MPHALIGVFKVIIFPSLSLSQFTNEADQENCKNNSIDYFKEINTSCVGGSSNFMGFQLRSWTVQDFGIYPKNWYGPSDGSVEFTAPSIENASDAYHSDLYTDDHYMKIALPALKANSTCENSSGIAQSCFRNLPILLTKNLGPYKPIRNSDGSTDLLIRIKYRGPAQPSGAQIPIGINGYYGSPLILPNSDTKSTWTTLESNVHLPSNITWQGPDFIYLDLFLRAGFEANVQDYVDFDAWEIYDNQGNKLEIPPEWSSFSEDQSTKANGNLDQAGDWAVTAIERMGAIAWWGSSSHYRTFGYAYGDTYGFARKFFRGETLGRSLKNEGYANHLASGLFFGDPLLQLSSAALLLDTEEDAYKNDYNYSNKANLTVYSDTTKAPDRSVYLQAFHGKAHLEDTRWELSACYFQSSPYECTQKNIWKEISNGKASLNIQSPKTTPITLYDIVEDKSIEQQVQLRLKVYQIGKESEAIFDFMTYDYKL